MVETCDCACCVSTDEGTDEEVSIADDVRTLITYGTRLCTSCVYVSESGTDFEPMASIDIDESTD